MCSNPSGTLYPSNDIMNLDKPIYPTSTKFKFYVWRTLWGTIVTLLALYNVLGMYKSHSSGVDHPDTSHITSFAFRMISICCAVDTLLMLSIKKLFNRQVLVHHGIMFVLILFASKYETTHKVAIDLFISTEIITITCWMAYFAENWPAYDRHIFHKFYLTIYGFLTIFWRFPVWFYLMWLTLTSASTKLHCFIGTIPLFILDIYWTYETVVGIFRPFDHSKAIRSRAKIE
jgi:hypothetical protein